MLFFFAVRPASALNYSFKDLWTLWQPLFTFQSGYVTIYSKVFYITFEEIKSQVSETFSAVSKSQDSSQTVPRFRDWIKSFGDLQFYFF